MPDYVDYAYIIAMMRLVIKNTEEFNATCSCGDCVFVKRATIYFKLFKSQADNRERLATITKSLLSEQDWFVFSFIMSFLADVDEDAMMDELFDRKDNMDNNSYLYRCDTLMNVKKFKNMMEPQKCH